MLPHLCLRLYGVAFLLGGPCAMAAPPNIVWIIADDMSPDASCYGAVGVKTPHLDALASAGKRFMRAYATAPVCSSSRSAFILGCYQTTTGLHAHDVENPQPLAAPYQPLPELLRKAGYFVTNAPAPDTVRSGKKITKAKTHYNFAHDPKVMYDGDNWKKRSPGQPFFAQYQVAEPHRPFPIPESYDEAGMQAIALPPNYPDHPLMMRDWYAYLRSVEVVDAHVGAICDDLKANGVWDDTIVIFFADHGRPMPWGKQWLNQEGLRVPMIVAGKGIEAGTVEEHLTSLIDLAPSLLQIVGQPIPNWMQGLPVLQLGYGDRKNIFAARDRCGDAQDRIRAIITADDKLVVKNFMTELPRLNWSGYKEASYPGMPLLRVMNEGTSLTALQREWLKPTRLAWECYDLAADPLSLHPSASQDAFAGAIAELENWITSSGDKGARPDPPTEPSLPDIQKAKRKDYQRAWKARLGEPEPTDRARLNWWLKSYGLPVD